LKAKLLTFMAFMVGLLAVCGPAFAHHGAAAYDMTKPVILKDAIVTKYLWANPHALIFLDAKDDKGAVAHWTVELGSPSAVALVGWTRTSLKPGDTITVYTFQSKTGVKVGRLNKIQFPDGTLLRDSQTGGDHGERSDNDVR
jgi:Family of unknown function (DUF6152)